jgi:glycosyltransferase involved in cell wall biosynthesis
MISVIIPTYNRTKLLMDRAIPSILAQTDPDWECLVVGDGTEMETVKEMESLVSWDHRFRFWNLAHDVYPAEHEKAWGLQGLTALNFGLDWARGDWISVLNDDDELTPDNHEVLLTEAEFTDAKFIYGQSDTWKNGQRIAQVYGSYPPRDGSVTQGSYIYRSSLEYRYRHDCYDRERNGDADMWLRMWDDGVRFAFVKTVVHHYHRNYP